jgi:DNA-binding NarL/FixJ family response regulator
VPERIDAAAEQIGIVLADDHPLIRGGLRRVLELEGDLEKLWAHVDDRPPRLPRTRCHAGCRACSIELSPRIRTTISNPRQSSPRSWALPSRVSA